MYMSPQWKWRVEFGLSLPSPPTYPKPVLLIGAHRATVNSSCDFCEILPGFQVVCSEFTETLARVRDESQSAPIRSKPRY
ncbi:hypothetical protein BDR03DRAFT_964932 [Suillus americanus]|nr:hypothetical protein BDR03DRAFT_964932 [Suillus americanus]